MTIRQTLPLHESSGRLRALYPECPRVYGVAVMGDLSRRRWWPLAEAAVGTSAKEEAASASAILRIIEILLDSLRRPPATRGRLTGAAAPRFLSAT
jgi:hypothetical protein